MTPLLTEATLDWRHDLDDAVRVVRWSAGGRLLAVSADGCVLVDRPGNVTRPTCGEPLDAVWIGEGRVVVAAADGLLFVGGGDVRTDRGCPTAVRACESTLAVASGEHIVAWDERAGSGRRIHHPRCGRLRDLAGVTPSSWVAVGSRGAVLLDLRLDTVDGRLELSGAVSAKPDPFGRIVAVGDLSGCIHLWRLGVDDETQCLDGYPDRVRRIAWGGQSEFVVAAADDELTWWPIDERCRARSEPDRGVGHERAITALDVGSHSLTCTGDAAGRVCIWAPGLPDKPVWSATVHGEVTAVAWSPRGDRICVASDEGDVAVWRVSPGLVA